MRRRRVLMVAAVLLVLATGVYVVTVRVAPHLPALGGTCEARTSSGTVSLDPTQMANAATIAAVGIRRGLPDRAIVIALATALQESKLENLNRGDRDSVGLFQQRPSQGWGSADEIADPRYAAGSFYSALVRVRGWEGMRITEAAQRVQRSAYPEAYERWSIQSSVLAEALAGRVTSAVTCSRVGSPVRRGTDAALALGTGLRLDWGDVSTIPSKDLIGLAVAVADDRAGWQYAHWMVAHSSEKGVERVSFGDRQWSAESGAWESITMPVGSQGRVVAKVYAP